MDTENLQPATLNEAENAEHKPNRKEAIALGFKNRTKGEAWFNIGSYVGVGYVGVTAISVFTTWLLNDKFPSVGNKIKSEAEKIGLSGTIGTIATLFVGGTVATVLPVKALEDGKPKIVKKLDYLLYSENEIRNNLKIQQSHKELEELPKQTWLSVFSSRVVAFAATLGVFFMIGSNKSPLHKFTQKYARQATSLDRMSGELGLKADKFFNGHRAGFIEAADKGERTSAKVFGYLGLDMFYTLITSVSLWISTRVFGGIIGQDAEAAKAKHERRTHHAKSSSSLETGMVPNVQNPADEAPHTQVTGATRFERVARPVQTMEFTA